MKKQTAPSISPVAKITTEVLAAKFGARQQTPRASYCRHGHWMNMVPTKMPNGWLLWDAIDADRLLAGETVKTPAADDIAAHHARKASNPAKLPAHIARKVAAKAQRPNITTSDEDEAPLSVEVAK